ncbi:MAG: hypothetical protein A3K19_29840 [Lentisphaerae bacterium RIFOXYB12_FULL_65_16]|nr:MAG: hypothetical protein A3K18_33450 [Lentisphaerae bacterium RIFOXYA12_64_32]OGV86531.1 MAG: hypothetical protein A3K19_29840 [Lentisphaerae bacterium RIFOXYB12_FULL_65_16]
MSDFRLQRQVTFKARQLAVQTMLMFLELSGSRRQFGQDMGTDEFRANLALLLNEPVDRVSSDFEMNYFLAGVPDHEIAEIAVDMTGHLLRQRSLEDYRFQDEYYLVAFDGTELFHFHDPHCSRCLVRKHSNGVTDYFHSVLEAKLVTNTGLAFTMGCEFIENPPGGYDKQTCERNHFPDLARKIKKRFPRLPVCALLDSLYACEPILDILLQYHWTFFIAFKEGSIPTLYQEAMRQIERRGAPVLRETLDDDRVMTFRWACNLEYRKHTLHAIVCDVHNHKTGEDTRFMYLTDFRPDQKNIKELINLGGRQRFKIENIGFNVQKNCGYGLEHCYGTKGFAWKNYYHFIQIAHALHQVMLHTDLQGKLLQEAGHAAPTGTSALGVFTSLKNLAKCLAASLANRILNAFALDAQFAAVIRPRWVFNST